MAQKQYSQEFKEQVIKECNEVGNVSIVARRHDISSNTIYGWISAAKKRGSVNRLAWSRYCYSYQQKRNQYPIPSLSAFRHFILSTFDRTVNSNMLSNIALKILTLSVDKNE